MYILNQVRDYQTAADLPILRALIESMDRVVHLKEIASSPDEPCPLLSRQLHAEKLLQGLEMG